MDNTFGDMVDEMEYNSPMMRRYKYMGATLEEKNKLVQDWYGNKLKTTIEGYSEGTITHWDDADTFTISSNGQSQKVRLQDLGMKFTDTVETSHYDKDGNYISPMKSAWNNKFKRNQLLVVAEMTGKSINDVTDADFDNVGNYQRNWIMHSLSTQDGSVFEAYDRNKNYSLPQTTEPINVFFKSNGTDSHGRTLASVANIYTKEDITRNLSTNAYFNTNITYDALDTLDKTIDASIANSMQAAASSPVYLSDTDNRVEEIADLSQASLYGLGASFFSTLEALPVVGQAITYWNKSRKEAGLPSWQDLRDRDVAKVFSGVSEKTNKGMVTAQQDAYKNYKEGNYLAAIGNFASIADLVLAESAGQAAILMAGGTAGAAFKALGATRAAFLATQGSFASYAGSMTSQASYDYSQNNQGKTMPYDTMALTFLGYYFAGAMESQVLNKIPSIIKPNSKFGQLGKEVVSSALGESVQEGWESGVDFLATRDRNVDNFNELGSNVGFGALAGFTTAGVTSAGGAAINAGITTSAKQLGKKLGSKVATTQGIQTEGSTESSAFRSMSEEVLNGNLGVLRDESSSTQNKTNSIRDLRNAGRFDTLEEFSDLHNEYKSKHNSKGELVDTESDTQKAYKEELSTLESYLDQDSSSLSEEGKQNRANTLLTLITNTASGITPNELTLEDIDKKNALVIKLSNDKDLGKYLPKSGSEPKFDLAVATAFSSKLVQEAYQKGFVPFDNKHFDSFIEKLNNTVYFDVTGTGTKTDEVSRQVTEGPAGYVAYAAAIQGLREMKDNLPVGTPKKTVATIDERIKKFEDKLNYMKEFQDHKLYVLDKAIAEIENSSVKNIFAYYLNHTAENPAYFIVHNTKRGIQAAKDVMTQVEKELGNIEITIELLGLDTSTDTSTDDVITEDSVEESPLPQPATNVPSQKANKKSSNKKSSRKKGKSKKYTRADAKKEAKARVIEDMNNEPIWELERRLHTTGKDRVYLNKQYIIDNFGTQAAKDLRKFFHTKVYGVTLDELVNSSEYGFPESMTDDELYTQLIDIAMSVNNTYTKELNARVENMLEHEYDPYYDSKGNPIGQPSLPNDTDSEIETAPDTNSIQPTVVSSQTITDTEDNTVVDTEVDNLSEPPVIEEGYFDSMLANIGFYESEDSIYDDTGMFDKAEKSIDKEIEKRTTSYAKERAKAKKDKAKLEQLELEEARTQARLKYYKEHLAILQDTVQVSDTYYTIARRKKWVKFIEDKAVIYSNNVMMELKAKDEAVKQQLIKDTFPTIHEQIENKIEALKNVKLPEYIVDALTNIAKIANALKHPESYGTIDSSTEDGFKFYSKLYNINEQLDVLYNLKDTNTSIAEDIILQDFVERDILNILYSLPNIASKQILENIYTIPEGKVKFFKEGEATLAKNNKKPLFALSKSPVETPLSSILEATGQASSLFGIFTIKGSILSTASQKAINLSTETLNRVKRTLGLVYLSTDKRGNQIYKTNNLNDTRNNAIKRILNSPANALFLEVDEESNFTLKESVLTAAISVLVDTLANSSTLDIESNVESKFKEFKQQGVSSESLINFQAEYGVPRRHLVRTLGQDMLKALGLKFKKDTDIKVSDKEAIVSSLGSILVSIGEDLNILQTTEIPYSLVQQYLGVSVENTAEDAVSYYTKFNTTNVDIVTQKKNITDTYKKIAAKVELESPRRVVPTLRPSKNYQKEGDKIGDTPVLVDSTGAESIKVLCTQAFKGNVRIKDIIFNPANLNNFRRIMGIPTKKEVENFSANEMVSYFGIPVKAIQNFRNDLVWMTDDNYQEFLKNITNGKVGDINKEFDALAQYANDNSYYLNWEIKNGARIYCNSNTANPSTQKHLIRSLFVPTETIGLELDLGDEVQRNSLFGAIAFAFDKRGSDASNRKFVEGLLEHRKQLGEDGLLQKVVDSLVKKDGDYKMETLGLVLTALETIETLHKTNNPNSGKVKVDLVTEFDGTTSGIAIGIRQFSTLFDENVLQASGTSSFSLQELENLIRDNGSIQTTKKGRETVKGILDLYKQATFKYLQILVDPSKQSFRLNKNVNYLGTNKDVPALLKAHIIAISNRFKKINDKVDKRNKGESTTALKPHEQVLADIGESNVVNFFLKGLYRYTDITNMTSINIDANSTEEAIKGVITSALRKMFKDPTMKGGYEAGAQTSIDVMVNDIISTMVKKFLDDTGDSHLSATMQYAFNINDDEQIRKLLQNNLFTGDSQNTICKEAYNLLYGTYSATVGEVVYAAVEANASNRKKTTESIRLCLNMFVTIFSKEHTKLVDRAYSEGWTVGQLEKETNALLAESFAPFINSAISTDPMHGIGIFNAVNSFAKNMSVSIQAGTNFATLDQEGNKSYSKSLINAVISRKDYQVKWANAITGLVQGFDSYNMKELIVELAKQGIKVTPVHDAIQVSVAHGVTASKLFNQVFGNQNNNYAMITEVAEKVIKFFAKNNKSYSLVNKDGTRLGTGELIPKGKGITITELFQGISRKGKGKITFTKNPDNWFDEKLMSTYNEILVDKDESKGQAGTKSFPFEFFNNLLLIAQEHETNFINALKDRVLIVNYCDGTPYIDLSRISEDSIKSMNLDGINTKKELEAKIQELINKGNSGLAVGNDISWSEPNIEGYEVTELETIVEAGQINVESLFDTLSTEVEGSTDPNKEVRLSYIESMKKLFSGMNTQPLQHVSIQEGFSDANFGQAKPGQITIIKRKGETATTENNLYKNTEEVYAHELIHGITDAFIRDPSTFGVTKEVRQLRQLHMKLKKVITPADFLPETADLNDPEVQKRGEALWDYVFNNPDAYNGIAELLAYGLTNPHLMKALNRVTLYEDTKKVTARSLFRRIWDSFVGFFKGETKVRDIFPAFAELIAGNADYASIRKDKNAYESLLRLHTNITNANTKAVRAVKATNLINKIAEFVTPKVFWSDEKLKGLIEKLSEYIATKGLGAIKIPKDAYTSKLSAAKFIARTVGLILISSKYRADALNTLSKLGLLKHDSSISMFLREFVPKDAMRRTMQTLSNATRNFEGDADRLRTCVYENLTSAFGKTLQKGDEAILTNAVLSTDMRQLLTVGYEYSDIKKLLKDANKRAEAISKQKDVVRSLILNKQKQNQAINLTKLLVLSMTEGINIEATRVNAESIATALGQGYATDKKLIEAIDTLATLSAINTVNDSSLQRLAEMNDAGVSNYLTAHTNYISQTTSKELSSKSVPKGQYKALLDSTYSTRIATVDANTQADMKAKDYILVEQLEGTSKLGLYKRAYKDKRSRSGGATLLAVDAATGINLENTLKSMEVDSSTVTTKFIDGLNRLAGIQLNAMLKEELTDSQVQQLLNKSSRYSPVINNKDGSTVTYRVNYTKRQLKDVLGQNENGFDILASMYATNKRSMLAPDHNKTILDALIADMKSNYDPKDKKGPKYIKLDRFSEDSFVADNFEALSKEVKEYVKKHDLYVREDLIVPLLGTKSAYLVDNKIVAKFTNTFSKKMLSNLEDILRVFGAFTKQSFVIRSPGTLLGNIASNFKLVWLHGHDPREVSKLHLDYLRYTRDYIVTRKKLEALQLKETMGTLVDKDISDITNLEHILNTNPVHKLVKAGMFPSVIEDLLPGDETSASKIGGYLVDTFEKKTTVKVPAFLQNVGKQVYMTEGSPYYDFMFTATQYSDFVARCVLYDLEMKRVKKGNLDLDSVKRAEDAILHNLLDQFIDYNTPQSSRVQWLNDVGLWMFTKYFLRIQYVIARHLTERPASVALMLLANSAMTPNLEIDSFITDAAIPVRDFDATWRNPADNIISTFVPVLLQ